MEDRILSDLTARADESAAHSTSAGMLAGLSEDKLSPLLRLILTSLDDDKAEDVVAIELAGKSEMADHMIIATGRSTRQVAAMAERLADKLKAEMGRNCRIEGRETCDWVLLDCGDAVVHLFRPEVREFYQLEKMWASEIAATASAR